MLSKEEKDAINTQLSNIEEQIAEIRTKIGQVEQTPAFALRSPIAEN